MTLDDFEKQVSKLKLNISFGLKHIEVFYLKDVVAAISIDFQKAYIHDTNIKRLSKDTKKELQKLALEFAETPPRERKMFK